MTYKPMHPRKRILKIIRELREVIQFKSWWNNNRLDARPFDLGADLASLKISREMLNAWDDGDQTEVARLEPLLVEALDHPV